MIDFKKKADLIWQIANLLRGDYKQSDKGKDIVLNKIAGHNFHNRSKYDFEKLKAEPGKIAANLRNYIKGFSASAREIIEYFNFDDQIDKMDDPKSKITKYFYVFKPLRSLEEIKADILAPEQ